MARTTAILLACVAADALRVTLSGSGSARRRICSSRLASYLQSPDSDTALLSARAQSCNDGVYEAEMAPLGFFTLQVTPIFKAVIERQGIAGDGGGGSGALDAEATGGGKIDVKIIEGSIRRLDPLSEGSEVVNRGVNLAASNRVSYRGGGGEWEVRSKIEVALDLEFDDKFNPLAAQLFRRAGSAIVGAACAAGASRVVGDVEAGVDSWAGGGHGGGVEREGVAGRV